MSKPPLEVVGAVILGEAGRVLCALRSERMSLAGHWEFPGGKIDPEESPEVALIREIDEELGCTIEVGELVADCTHAYPNLTVRLRTYQAWIVSGEAHPAEHERLEWVEASALAGLVWAPADLPTVEALAQAPIPPTQPANM